MRRSRVTLHDVAALAGVSHQTVSRVINNSDRVLPATKARVKEAIKELGYRPNTIARSMVKGNTRTIGCITPDIVNPVFNYIVQAAQNEARKQGFFMLIGNADTSEEARHLLDELLNRMVDGLVVLNPHDDERYKYFEPLAEKNIPIVYLKNLPKNGEISSVTCDDFMGSYMAIEYLINLGHKNIATIYGLPNEECTKDRIAGYFKALEDADIESDPYLQVEGDWSPESGAVAVEQLLSTGKPFSGIFVQNDRMAVGVVRQLRESGYDVPNDISVIAYDDIPMASYTDPPLTTIRQPLEQFGIEAAKIIINRINNKKNEPVNIRLVPTLIERKSCTRKNHLKGGSQ